MALADTFVRQVKHTGKPTGDKHTDGGGMYLLVKAGGKYWRMDYTHADKRKTLALGVYPTVSLAKARQRRDKARELLADGIDPSTAKKEDKQAKADAAVNTFKAVALTWHTMKAKGDTSSTTLKKRLAHFETHVFPAIGNRPVNAIKPAEILALLQAVADKGTAYTAGRLRALCGQVFCFAIQTGLAENDPTVSMRGAIEKPAVKHRPALTTRREFGEFVRDLRDTTRAEPLTRLCARFGLLTWTRPGELRHTLEETLEQVAILAERKPTTAIVDKGYRGVEIEGVRILRSGQKRGITRTLKAMIHRRSAIEPAIGHMKMDGRLGRWAAIRSRVRWAMRCMR